MENNHEVRSAGGDAAVEGTQEALALANRLTREQLELLVTTGYENSPSFRKKLKEEVDKARLPEEHDLTFLTSGGALGALGVFPPESR